MKIIPVGKQGRDQVPFPQLSSHSLDLEAISYEQQPERQEHEERGKRSPWHVPWLGKKTKLKKYAEELSLQPLLSGPAELLYSLSVSKGKAEPDWQKSKTDNGANRARLGICAADRDEFKRERKACPRRIQTKNPFALSVPPTLQSVESAFELIKQLIWKCLPQKELSNGTKKKKSPAH